METIRLEVCIYENEYEMCVSFVLLHGVCLLSICMVCLCCAHGVCCLYKWLYAHRSPVCTCDMWNLSHLECYYMYGWFYSGVEYSKSLK